MPSLEARLKELVGAVEGRRSVLVEGPGGSGKSVLVQTLLSDMGKKSECVTVFMGEQIDSKVCTQGQVLFAGPLKYSGFVTCVVCSFQALVGTFLCTNTPGEFVWTPGVLAKVCVNVCSGCGVNA